MTTPTLNDFSRLLRAAREARDRLDNCESTINGFHSAICEAYAKLDVAVTAAERFELVEERPLESIREEVV